MQIINTATSTVKFEKELFNKLIYSNPIGLGVM